MTRFALLTTFALVALVGPAGSQPPGVRFATAGATGATLSLTETVVVPVAKKVTVTVEIDGKAVQQEREVTVYEAAQIERKLVAKDARVTDGTGKAVGADKLTELLKKPAPIVILTAPLSAEHRALFKDSTLFLDLTPAPVEAPKKK